MMILVLRVGLEAIILCAATYLQPQMRIVYFGQIKDKNFTAKVFWFFFKLFATLAAST